MACPPSHLPLSSGVVVGWGATRRARAPPAPRHGRWQGVGRATGCGDLGFGTFLWFESACASVARKCAVHMRSASAYLAVLA